MGDEKTKGLIGTARTYASFVKLSHTVFALPFALASMAAAYAVPTQFIYVSQAPGNLPRGGSFDQHVPFSWVTLLLILACMVGARSFAMAVNRILDRKIDALNPRTAMREIPAGRLSLPAAWGFAVASAAVYWAACALLGNVVLWLSPIPIALMLLYPFTKRVSALCHLFLGASLGLAPVGAWIAVRGMGPHHTGISNRGGEWTNLGWRGDLFPADAIWRGIEWSAASELAPWLLGAAVMLWVAGFDVIYALQDDEFDRQQKLHSIPVALGRRRALWVSRLMHFASAALFFAFIYVLTHPVALANGMDVTQYTQFANWVWVAPCVMVAGMAYQHSLVKTDDLSRVNMAFFTVNGVISVVFGVTFILAHLLA